jgi:glycosyltransferase involved in cell wall biosynthesis
VKLALVSSSYLPRPGVLERHVHELAAGLTLRGVEVEVLTQDPRARLPAVSEFEGFVVRRFVAPSAGSRLGVSPGLWEHLRRSARSFDVVHAHGTHPSLAFAAGRARPRRYVFTLHAPVRRLLRRPYLSVFRGLISHGAQLLCAAAAESEALIRVFPHAARQIGVVRHGVDAAAIRTAQPFPHPGVTVLTVGSIERYKRIDIAIGAMAALAPAFRLAIVGDGPAREKLLAHAADLEVSSRVHFTGAIPDAELYRWLRTATVMAALAEDEASGLDLTGACCAGAQIVASDIPVHREAAAPFDGTGVFVSPAGSPLDAADAIREAAALAMHEPPQAERPRSEVSTWDETVEQTLGVYRALIRGTTQVAPARS